MTRASTAWPAPDRRLGLDKRAMERHMRSIRAKLADWRPGGIPRLQSRASELV
jgi:hypothetical protein